jgi:hypothetical protein
MNALLMAATLVCTGPGNTYPPTTIELEVRPPSELSYIRYEYTDVSLGGTAYSQAVGEMKVSRRGDRVIYRTGENEGSTVLTLRMKGGQIISAALSHYGSNLKDAPVTCSFQE